MKLETFIKQIKTEHDGSLILFNLLYIQLKKNCKDKISNVKTDRFYCIFATIHFFSLYFFKMCFSYLNFIWIEVVKGKLPLRLLG